MPPPYFLAVPAGTKVGVAPWCPLAGHGARAGTVVGHVADAQYILECRERRAPDPRRLWLLVRVDASPASPDGRRTFYVPPAWVTPLERVRIAQAVRA